jgi:hypothetical protein
LLVVVVAAKLTKLLLLNCCCCSCSNKYVFSSVQGVKVFAMTSTLQAPI